MDESATIRVGIAIVLWKNSVLIGIRPQDTDLPGLHEFPGGKCLLHESAAECAIRECLEETGMHVEVQELLMHTVHQYDHRTVDLSFFLCQPSSKPLEVTLDPFAWTPFNELNHCQFPDGNREVVKLLLDRFMDSL